MPLYAMLLRETDAYIYISLAAKNKGVGAKCRSEPLTQQNCAVGVGVSQLLCS